MQTMIKEQIKKNDIIANFKEFWSKYSRFLPGFDIKEVFELPSKEELIRVRVPGKTTTIFYPSLGGKFFKDFLKVDEERLPEMVFSDLLQVSFSNMNDITLYHWRNPEFKKQLRSLMIRKCEAAFPEFKEVCKRLDIPLNKAIIKLSHDKEKFLNEYENTHDNFKSNLMNFELKTVQDQNKENCMLFAYNFPDRPNLNNIFLFTEKDNKEEFKFSSEMESIKSNFDEIKEVKEISHDIALNEILENVSEKMFELYFVDDLSLSPQNVGEVLDMPVSPRKLYFSVEENILNVVEYDKIFLEDIFELTYGFTYVPANEACLLKAEGE